MDLKLILESLDSDVFTQELKDKVSVILEAEVVQRVTEEVEAAKVALDEEKSTEIEEFKASLVEKLDNYFEYLTTELSEKEIAEATNEAATFKKAAVLESIKALASEFAITIAEAKECDEEEDEEEEDEDEEDAEKKALKESLDKLMEEHTALKALYLELAKIGLVKESMEDLTITQQEKFAKMANTMELKSTAASDVETFLSQLDTIKEALEFVGEKKEVVVESTNDKKTTLAESAKKFW